MSETTQTAAGERILKRDYLLSRVEGEGGVYVRWKEDRLEEVRLDILEPPRFFEALLRGRHLREVADITARICGICPVAYQMSAVHALEAALGIVITPEIRRLRPAGYSSTAISMGDFDGDGNIDLAVTRYYNSSVGILLGNGDGSCSCRNWISKANRWRA